MWLILQQKKPDDYVIATGKQHSVRYFCETAFRELGIELKWQGKGVDEKGIDKKTKKVLIEIDQRQFRPAEVDSLMGNSAKARQRLGWQPEINFKELVKEMVGADLEEAKKDVHLTNGGFKIKSNFEQYD